MSFDSFVLYYLGLVFVVLFGFLNKRTILFIKISVRIRHVLTTLQKLRKNLPSRELNTLHVHIVSSVPLYQSEPWWEGFLKGIPKLKKLYMVFIIQNRDFKQSFKSTRTKLKDGRVVEYTAHQMFYHMYFSDNSYEEPDAVIIYDNTSAMLGHDDAFHSEISYRNMTSKRRTVVVIMDPKEEKLDEGVRAVSAIRPVEQIKDDVALSEKVVTLFSSYYYTCLRRK